MICQGEAGGAGRMRIYLDLCCLKRPFDDLNQQRIRLESEVVLGVLQGVVDFHDIIRSGTHDVENAQNVLPGRRARVELWLSMLPLTTPNADDLARRAKEIAALGVKSFDALHVASAELAGADVFVTCDDRLLAVGQRLQSKFTVRFVSLLDLAKELP